MRVTIIFLASIVSAMNFLNLGCSPYSAVDDSPRSRRFPFFISEVAPTTAESSSLAHYAMGVIYDNDGRIDAAIEEYKEALKHDNDSDAIHTRLGADYLLRNEFEEAAFHLELAKKLDPESIKPRVLLALIYTTQRRFDEATGEYQEIIKKTHLQG